MFRSSFAPSEEWARFLFIYITFIGGIEAFYRHKHIAVDMFVNMISGASRKAVDIVASLFMLAALVLLLAVLRGAPDAGHLFRRYRREYGLHQRDAARHGLCRDHHPPAGHRAADPHARRRVQHRAQNGIGERTWNLSSFWSACSASSRWAFRSPSCLSCVLWS
ncbi:MAG: TRAP transporter small permease [Bilophila wadsworthia]